MSREVQAHKKNVKHRINGGIVDYDRCQVVRGDIVETLEPKVMNVLKYLVEHRDEVVSQETLFNAVWPNQVFSQSLVQRAIALLRKSLADDATLQQVIKTYPKRGYGFVAKAELLNDERRPGRNGFITLIVLVLMLLAVIYYLTRATGLSTTYTHLEPFTASAANSFSGVYSPDGRSIAYLEQDNDKQTILRLYSRDTGKTSNAFSFDVDVSSVAFSKDGSRLAAVKKIADDVRELELLILNPARTEVFERRKVLTLPDTQYVSQVQWRDSDTWYFIANKTKGEQPSHLLSFNLSSKQLSVMMKTAKSSRYKAIALSPNAKRLAIVQAAYPENTQLGFLTLPARQYTPLYKTLSQQFNVAWHPDNRNIAVVTENERFFVNIERVRTTLQIPEYRDMSYPAFAPDGSEFIYVQHQVDSDIYQYQANSSELIKRVDSTAIDIAPRLSPDSNSVVFLSKRAGFMQVFVAQEKQELLVFDNPSKSDLLGPAIWNNSGNTLAVSQNHQITLVDYPSLSQTTIKPEMDNLFIYQWYHHENALLVGYFTEAGVQAAKLDLDTLALSLLKTNEGGNFRLNNDDQLIYPAGDQLIDHETPIDITQTTLAATFPPVLTTSAGLLIQGYDKQGDKQLWLINNNRRTAQHVMTISDEVARAEDVSANGNVILFSSTMHTTSNLMRATQ